MVQGYYTLQEAAQHLNLSLDELKMMAQKGKIRSFQDRGTWRFRVQDIQELARQRGAGSEPELPLTQASPPPASGAGPRTPASKSRDSEVFDFSLDAGNLAGLEQYFSLCAGAGLISRARPLEFAPWPRGAERTVGAPEAR